MARLKGEEFSFVSELEIGFLPLSRFRDRSLKAFVRSLGSANLTILGPGRERLISLGWIG